MAIKLRRGNYADLDTSRLVAGEPVISLDKIASYGRQENYVAIAVAPSQVVRLATYDAIAQVDTSVTTAIEKASEASASAKTATDSIDLSKSWAIGQTGVRTGEDTNNSKYYSEQSNTYMQSTANYYSLIEKAMGGAVSSPAFFIDFDTGNLMGDDLGRFIFSINTTTGNLVWALSA